jgi:hypothetical protein
MTASIAGVEIAGELGGTMTFPGSKTVTAIAKDPGQDALVARIVPTGQETVVLRRYGEDGGTGSFALASDDTADAGLFIAGQSVSGFTVDGTAIPSPASQKSQAFVVPVLFPPDAGANPTTHFAQGTRSVSTGLDVSKDFIVWAGTFNGDVRFDSVTLVGPDAGSDGFVIAIPR